MFIIIIIIVFISWLLYTRQENFSPITCVTTARCLRNMINSGELTNKEAEMLWISQQYDANCGVSAHNMF
jgi:hypothetical protein